jgi:hypothetical protein
LIIYKYYKKKLNKKKGFIEKEKNEEKNNKAKNYSNE